MEIHQNLEDIKMCSSQFVLAVNDTMNVISGKWKLPIIGTLMFGKKRFKDMEREIPKINPRMLSKELKDLEANGIVSRTVHNTTPVKIEYELTKSGKTLNKVLDSMVEWGLHHRQIVLADD